MTMFSTLIILMFICEGALFVLFPSLAVVLFGPTLGSKVYSILFIGFGVAACIGIFVSSVILPYGVLLNSLFLDTIQKHSFQQFAKLTLIHNLRKISRIVHFIDVEEKLPVE